MASAAEGRARRLMAWLRGHPACAWPVSSTVVMGLHGLTDALCFPRKAKQTWATMLGSIRKWSAEDEPFRTQSEQFNAKVMDPRAPINGGTISETVKDADVLPDTFSSALERLNPSVVPMRRAVTLAERLA